MKEYFRPFVPTDEKILTIAKHLMYGYLNLPDYLRTWPAIHRMINRFMAEPIHAIYEFGNFDGIIIFSDIIFGFNANLIFKIWNPAGWSHGLVRAVRELIKTHMDGLKLVRLESSSPDPRIVRMAGMVGFEIEGMKKMAFPFDGKLYDDCFFSIVKKTEGG